PGAAVDPDAVVDPPRQCNGVGETPSGEVPVQGGVSRRPMAAPSAGSSKVHEVEQREIITRAFE
ncbi:hypothetical protein, partial [Lentzea indica]|uniref:hypothetical protein n=1 Tax=Lentzea indica TaxID=2604800 RepID=UPI00143C339B